jgi:hypothetical protein
MTQTGVDLAGIFQAVTQSLSENQQSLDQADAINQDHGTNMVQTFQTITRALENQKGNSDHAALTYAAQKLSESATSGSGRMYAENLTRAAGQVQGQKVDMQGAMQILQTLIGSGQGGQNTNAQAAGGDLFGSLLGGLTGAGTPAEETPAAASGDLFSALLGSMGGQEPSAQPVGTAGGGDILGAILGGLSGSEGASESAQQSGGLGLQNLVSAGLAYMQARQQGQDNMQALVQAFVTGSGMGNTIHRNQSTQIVVQSFLQALRAVTGSSHAAASK